MAHSGPKASTDNTLCAARTRPELVPIPKSLPKRPFSAKSLPGGREWSACWRHGGGHRRSGNGAEGGGLGESGPGCGLRGRPVVVTGGNSWQQHHPSSKLNNLSYSLTRDLDIMTNIGDITSDDLKSQQDDLNDESISNANTGCIWFIF